MSAPTEDAVRDGEQAPEQPSSDLAVVGEGLDLTLRGTDGLNPAQWRALQTVCDFDVTTKAAQPHVEAFLHFCVSRGYDPFAGDIFLRQRGEEYTRQVTIKAYLRMAAETGRFIGFRDAVWTGDDSDDASWRHDKDSDVMRRVWRDHWPAALGHPGAARVTLDYYDEKGVQRTTQAEAQWAMFCPTMTVQTFDENGRMTGLTKEVPVPFWANGGGSFMIKKCASALALRETFPERLGGIYIHEELQRSDQQTKRETKEDVAANTAAQRQAQFMAAGRRGRVVVGETVPQPAPADGDDDVTSTPLSTNLEPPAEAPQPAPAPVFEDPAAVAATAAEEERVNVLNLHREFVWQAQVMGRPTDELSRRYRNLYGSVEKMTAEQLFKLVGSLRSAVATRLAGNGDDVAAVNYRKVTAGQCGPVEWLTGDDK